LFITARLLAFLHGHHARKGEIMKLVIGFVFATALVATPALAYDCASKSNVTASAPVSTAPVQTAEAPVSTVTK
jgi:hypothetical protein